MNPVLGKSISAAPGARFLLPLTPLQLCEVKPLTELSEFFKRFYGGTLNGRTITVNEARPKKEYGAGDGKYGGGGFRGGKHGGNGRY